jgi:hypothetical protein
MINYYAITKMPSRSRLVPFDLQEMEDNSIFNTETRYDRPGMAVVWPMTHVPVIIFVLLVNFVLSLYVLIGFYDLVAACGNSEYAAAAYIFVLLPAFILYNWLVEWLQVMTRDDQSERVQLQAVAARWLLQNMTADYLAIGGTFQIITANLLYDLGSSTVWGIYTYMGITSVVFGVTVWGYGLWYWFLAEVKD